MPDRFPAESSVLVPPDSLCERCDFCRQVRGRASTFLMCTALPDKYPSQPVLRCAAFRAASKPPQTA
jgi:hypothetical protein